MYIHAEQHIVFLSYYYIDVRTTGRPQQLYSIGDEKMRQG